VTADPGLDGLADEHAPLADADLAALIRSHAAPLRDVLVELWRRVSGGHSAGGPDDDGEPPAAAPAVPPASPAPSGPQTPFQRPLAAVA
jgi:hypothetical protein